MSPTPATLQLHLPFKELREQSLINEVANDASEENFGAEIRANLAGY